MFFASPKSTNKKLIVVKLDQIGDYILFRNFLEILKKSTKYQNYELTLLANKECKDLAESLDSNIVDQFIWMDKQKFIKWKFFRKYFLAKLKRLYFDVLISPLYSRENCWTEPVVEAVTAVEKIGSSGDLTNITAVHRFVANDNYTRLVQAQDVVTFEFLRNKEFFENLLENRIDLKKPRIVVASANAPIKSKYAVLFPGAKGKYRRWAEEKFAGIADYLSEKYHLDIVICGSEQDRKISKNVLKYAASKKITDLSGKTKLSELPAIFHGAQLVITNDTSAYHIAGAVGTKTICLSNGNTFGRFVPYPKEVNEHVKYAYPPEIEQNFHNFHEVVDTFKFASRLDINLITTDTVRSLIDGSLQHRPPG